MFLYLSIFSSSIKRSIEEMHQDEGEPPGINKAEF